MPPEADTAANAPLDDYCKTYRVAMIRELEHVGDGTAAWSAPLCPRTHQMGLEGCICKGEVKEALVDDKKEPVKSDAGSTAAKGTDAKAATPAAAPKPAV